jgi:hypothetical protein
MTTTVPYSVESTLACNERKPIAPWSLTVEIVTTKQAHIAGVMNQTVPIVFDDPLDATNSVMKNWLSTVPVWTKCVYMELEFIVVDSRKGKWLLWTEIVTKEPNDDRKVNRWVWINNFFSWITKNFALIRPAQVLDIIDNTDFFPQGYTYMMNWSLHGPEFGNTIWRTNAYKVWWYEESLAHTLHRDGSDLCALRYSLPLC